MTRLAIAVLVLASCRGDERPTTPVANVAPMAPRGLPAGWVKIEPTDERLRCANHASDEWRISIEGGVARIIKVTEPGSDTGPPLPFAAPPPLAPARGRRHTLAFGGGFLVGFDAGEWGGSLHWYASDGSGHQQLARANVQGLVALGPELALSIEGLAHLGVSEGAVRWIERRRGALAAADVTLLPDAPQTYALAGDAVYLLTTSSLARLERDRVVTLLQLVRTQGLYPNSMAFDARGALWIGMRQLVLRLVPEGHRFTETWLAREGCRRAEQVKLDCICGG